MSMEQNPSGEKVKILTTNDEYTFNGVIQVPARKITIGVVYENGSPDDEMDTDSVFKLDYDVPDGVRIAVTEFETGDDGTAITCIAETDEKDRCTLSAQDGGHLCHIHAEKAKENEEETETDVSDNTIEDNSNVTDENKYVISYTGSFEAKRVVGVISEGKASFHNDEFEYHAYGRITNEFLEMVESRYDPSGETGFHRGFY